MNTSMTESMVSKSFFDQEEDEENTLDPDEVEQLIRDVRANNKYKMDDAQPRNVLMVGRTRTGKTTFSQVLKDPTHQPTETSIFSQTAYPTLHCFSIEDVERKRNYMFNIIDTPGLKEQKRIGEIARTDDAILNTINFCLKNEITKINTLLIFVSFDIGITSEDISTFKTFFEMFGHENIQIGIVITRSENKSDDWKKKIVVELEQQEYFHNVLKKDNLKILFSGCVDQIKNKTVNNIKDAKKLFSKVYRMREIIIKFIIDSEIQILLLSLPIATKFKNVTSDIIKEQNEILLYLGDPSNDLTSKNSETYINQFIKNIELISKNDGILTDPVINKSISSLKKKIFDVTKNFGADLRKKLTANINFETGQIETKEEENNQTRLMEELKKKELEEVKIMEKIKVLNDIKKSEEMKKLEDEIERFKKERLKKLGDATEKLKKEILEKGKIEKERIEKEKLEKEKLEKEKLEKEKLEKEKLEKEKLEKEKLERSKKIREVREMLKKENEKEITGKKIKTTGLGGILCIHKDYKCDGCEEDGIEGKRYQCFFCESFDLCEKCFKCCFDNNTHDRSHPFKVHIDTSGIHNEVVFSPANITHNKISCNNCKNNKQLVGRRFTCSKCPDFDLCEVCYLAKDTFHSKDHVFSYVEPEKTIYSSGIDYSVKYEKELRLLREMGLVDNELGIELLIKNNGDINLTTMDYINTNK